MKEIFRYLLLLVLARPSISQAIDSIVVIPSSQLTYHIVLPDARPISNAIFFFDPSGNGSYPVKKYAALADKYAAALIGSNDSKNGRLDLSIEIMDEVIRHAEVHFLPENYFKILSGFSGGSRTAVHYSTLEKGVGGVIGCGSGFTPNLEISSISSKYAGLIGISDMNYLEMIQNEDNLTSAGVSNTLIEFDGGHTWPPLKNYEAGLDWLTENSDFWNRYMVNVVDSLTGIENYVSLARHLKRGVKSDLVAPTTYDRLESQEFKKEENDVREIWKREVQVQNQLNQAFSTIHFSQFYEPSELKSTSWWKKMVQNLSKEHDSDERNVSNKRLLGFLRANAFERGAFALPENPSIAEQYFGVFSIATDESWYSLLWLGKAYAAQAKWPACKTALKKALNQGMENFDLLQKDPLFSTGKGLDVITSLQK